MSIADSNLNPSKRTINNLRMGMIRASIVRKESVSNKS